MLDELNAVTLLKYLSFVENVVFVEEERHDSVGPLYGALTERVSGKGLSIDKEYLIAPIHGSRNVEGQPFFLQQTKWCTTKIVCFKSSASIYI